MKRLIGFLFLPLLILLLAGCGSSSLEGISFFYCRHPNAYQYFESDGVIAAESRDLSGHNGDLQYMIALYLAGPLEESLISPFPRNTRLIEAKKQNSTIHIELSDLGNSMTDSEFSLAAACLSKTCMLFADGTDVTIKSGVRTITLNAENMVLLDSAIPEPTEGE